MKRTRTIPVVSNTLHTKSQPRSISLTHRLMAVGFIFVTMIFIVWLKVETGATVARIAKLEAQIAEQTVENNELSSKILKLSSLDRIKNVAAALGLQFIGHENLVKIEHTKQANVYGKKY